MTEGLRKAVKKVVFFSGATTKALISLNKNLDLKSQILQNVLSSIGNNKKFLKKFP